LIIYRLQYLIVEAIDFFDCFECWLSVVYCLLFIVCLLQLLSWMLIVGWRLKIV